jgi:sirohydrochlorin ferrochelatase
VKQLTDGLRKQATGRFQQVGCCFLELATPSIPEAIDRAVESGATRITLLPYFLAAGTHIAEDIPKIVAEKRRDHPEVQIEIAPYLGKADGVVPLLLSLVDTSPART